jgi:hypothetical protein
MSDSTRKALANAAASSRMEGFTVTRQHLADAQKILDGKMTLKDQLARIQSRSVNR